MAGILACRRSGRLRTLPPSRQTPGHRQEESAVATFVQQDARVWALYWQAAEHERPRGEPEGLACGFSLFPDEFDHPSAAQLLFRYDEVRMGGAEDGSGAFQASGTECG
jgi:hypothetical protein